MNLPHTGMFHPNGSSTVPYLTSFRCSLTLWPPPMFGCQAVRISWEDPIVELANRAAVPGQNVNVPLAAASSNSCTCTVRSWTSRPAWRNKAMAEALVTPANTCHLFPHNHHTINDSHIHRSAFFHGRWWLRQSTKSGRNPPVWPNLWDAMNRRSFLRLWLPRSLHERRG